MIDPEVGFALGLEANSYFPIESVDPDPTSVEPTLATTVAPVPAGSPTIVTEPEKSCGMGGMAASTRDAFVNSAGMQIMNTAITGNNRLSA